MNPLGSLLREIVLTGPQEMVWKERERVKMACLAFKSFLAYAHEGKEMPTSDADDGRCYTLHLRAGALCEHVRR